MDALSYLFLVITVIATLITAFSVVSNLSIFITNHTTEINILRAIGFTTRQITVAYSIPLPHSTLATSSSRRPLSLLPSRLGSPRASSSAISYPSKNA